MLKLNPYAKTARRHAILKHDPEVRTETAELEVNAVHYLLAETKNLFVLPLDQG